MGQGAAQAAQIRRPVGVGEVLGELWAVDVVEAAEGLLGVRCQADLASVITGL